MPFLQIRPIFCLKELRMARSEPMFDAKEICESIEKMEGVRVTLTLPPFVYADRSYEDYHRTPLPQSTTDLKILKERIVKYLSRCLTKPHQHIQMGIIDPGRFFIPIRSS